MVSGDFGPLFEAMMGEPTDPPRCPQCDAFEAARVEDSIRVESARIALERIVAELEDDEDDASIDRTASGVALDIARSTLARITRVAS